ncbi:MAG: hypothetical protein JXR97_04745 [Planctomycetes bacterium]|nr:hypothetical protein [Planctomycetota bacterium]
MAAEPALPAGLESPGTRSSASEPALPGGLGGDNAGPALPSGLSGKAESEKPADTPTGSGFPLNGFWETRIGTRLQEDRNEKEMSILETRLRLETEKHWDRVALRLSADLLADGITEEFDTDLERGEGLVDLREANILLRPLSFMDIKAGRQILTWGTGDLLFLNDLFPKDWQAFFIGRDTEYLKAPSDALKASFFTPVVNLDFIYTPRFDADRGITGERISYYNSSAGKIVGRNMVSDLARPDDCFDDDEWALRLYRNVRGIELAAYAYRGFWKSPAGMDSSRNEATYPALDVYGASARGQLGKGIANFEFAYYDSREDEHGTDPLTRNSEWRFLVGYEMEIAKDLTAGMQYYVELMDDYGNYQRNAFDGKPENDEYRQLVTLRLTKLLMNQNLTLSTFIYYSPSDRDAYIRPNVNYKLNDSWTAEAGGNLFFGEDDHTFFGQFEDNTNMYLSIRRSF